MPTTSTVPTAATPIKVFPWLGSSDLREALGRIAVAEKSLSLPSQVARLAIRRRAFTPLNVLFPTIGPDVELLALGWSARHRNVLLRHGLAHGRDLNSVTVGGLMESWSVGPKSTETILSRFAQRALDEAHYT